jgi:hypothetical protein
MEHAPSDEAEELVEGVVDNGRRQIISDHSDLIDRAAEELQNFRQFNAVMSEIRRRI